MKLRSKTTPCGRALRTGMSTAARRAKSPSLERTAGFILMLLVSIPASADDADDNRTMEASSRETAGAPAKSGRFAQFTFENDLLFSTDRYYTDGVQAAWGGRNERPNFALAAIERVVCGKEDCGDGNRATTVHKIGQLMYTPVDITVVAAQPNDRPWGGFLYYATESTYIHPAAGSTTTIGLQLGIVGPNAFTEQTQKFIHKTFSGRDPRGWDNQLGGEPGIGVSYWHEWRLMNLQGKVGDGVAWIGAGGMVGNVFTYGQASFKVAFGRNIPIVVGPQIGTKAMPSPPVVTQGSKGNMESFNGMKLLAHDGLADPKLVDTKDRFSTCLWLFSACYMFAAVDARGVARNLFLDGNTFRNNNGNIDKQFFVYDLTAGFRLRFGHQLASWADGWYLDFTRTRRSSEFSSPFGDAAIQRFAAITVGREF